MGIEPVMAAIRGIDRLPLDTTEAMRDRFYALLMGSTDHSDQKI